ncbi:MAG: hypothetical protein V3S47_02625 [Acidobacteriota bacterium]
MHLLEPTDHKEYKSHKTVRAMRIRDIIGLRLYSADPRNIDGYVVVDQTWIDRHHPKVGGWYVLYEDGYESFSPAEAFEAGYTEVE